MTCAVECLTDVFLVEEVLHITRECGLVATHVEGVASGEVYQVICRHLPRCLKVLHAIDGEIATAEGVVSIVVGEVLPIQTDAETFHGINGEAEASGELCGTTFLHALLVEGHLSVVISVDARSNLTLSICEGLTL